MSDISETLLKARNDVICIKITHNLWLEIRRLRLQGENDSSTRKSIIYSILIISMNMSFLIEMLVILALSYYFPNN